MLVPGAGIRFTGGHGGRLYAFLQSRRAWALINASRAVIYAFDDAKYKDRFGDNWEKCIEQAAIDAKMELAKREPNSN